MLRDNFQLWYTGPFSQHIRLILRWYITHRPRSSARSLVTPFIFFSIGTYEYSHQRATHAGTESDRKPTWFLEHKLTCQTKKSCEGTVTLGSLSFEPVFCPQMSDFRVIHQGESPVLRKARGSAVTSCDDAKLGWASHIYALWNILAAF